jgi:hypothetical protein
MTLTAKGTSESEAPAGRAAEIARFLEGLDLPDRRLGPHECEQAVVALAAQPELWQDLVVDSPDTRWWIVLYRTAAYEVRLLSWEFDQSSGWHDHGGSSGGFVVTSGVLEEDARADDEVSIVRSQFGPGEHGGFDAAYVHDVRHAEGRPAVSIHAYSPPLTHLVLYEPTPYGFVVREVVPDDRRGL